MAADVATVRQMLIEAYREADANIEFFEILNSSVKARDLISFFQSKISWIPCPTKDHMQFRHKITNVVVAWSHGQKVVDKVRRGIQTHLKEVNGALQEIFNAKNFNTPENELDLDLCEDKYKGWRKKQGFKA